MAKKKRIKDQGQEIRQTKGAFGNDTRQDGTNIFDQEIDVQEGYNKAEDFLNKYKVPIFGILGLILVSVLGFWAYNNLYKPPREAASVNNAYKAQEYFDKDQFDQALNGDGVNDGFLDIIGDYGGTKIGNLSKYYAGVCYLQLGNYDEAIDYLSDFKSKDMVVSSMALGGIGDAHMQLGNSSEGIGFYEKAAANSDNQVTAPMYHFRAGVAKEQNGDMEGAKKHYEIIEEKYPTSAEGRDVAKYLARVGS